MNIIISRIQSRIGSIHVKPIVISCIKTATIKVPFNGSTTSFILPGAPAGDPVSSYIFVLCLKRLSRLINCAVDTKKWLPFRMRRSCPKISHPCFADEMLFFVKATL